MKQKLILVALIVLLTVVSQDSMSLGLKEIQVDSGLNQPLKARVELMVREDEDVSELKVNLADAQSYKKVGLDKSFVPRGIQVAIDKKNPRQINITSNAPITEPIVSLLLDISWENGQILREFTVLLDPPVYNTAENVVIKRMDDSGFTEQPTVAEEQADQTKPEVAVELTERDSKTADEVEVIDNAEMVDAQPAAEVIDEVEMVEAEEVYDSFGEIEVMQGDTLWSLAKNNKPSEVSTQQMVEALFNKNPGAFAGNNINRLIKGSKLKVPAIGEIQAISQAEALNLMRSHNSTWQPPQTDDSYTALQTSEPAEQPASATTVEKDYGVELMGSDDQEQRSGDNKDGGNSNNLSENAAAEELYNKESENTELRERVSELEDLVEQQQQALEIKSDDMANLQDQLGDEPLESTISEVENAEIDDVWGDEQDSTSDAQQQEQQPTTAEIDELSQISETDSTTDTEEVDVMLDDLTVDEDADTAVDEENEVDTDTESQTENTDSQQSAVEPPAEKEHTRNLSTIDKAVNWVVDNLRWIFGGLIALIVLLFVPRFLKSRGGSAAAEEESFIDDIKAKTAEVEEEVEDVVDTKLNEPLTEQTDELLQEAEQQVDESSLFEKAEEMDDKLDEAVEELQAQEDDFDLDGFLNDEQPKTKESPKAEPSTVEPQETQEDEFDFDLSEFDDLEKESGLAEAEQQLEQSVDKGSDSIEDFVEDLSDELDSGSSEAADLDDDIAELEDEFGLEGLHDLGEIDDLDDVKTGQDAEDLDVSSLEDEIDLESDKQHQQEDEFEQLKQGVADSLDLSNESDNTEDTIMIDDEDFDLGIDLDDMMEDKDAINVKFDLAKAYLEMGDSDGAKNLLKEVLDEGSPDLVEQAKKLLDDI